MKKHLKLLCMLAAVAFISCAYAYAASGFSYLVKFQRHSYAQSGSPEGPDDYDFEGKRTPGKPVLGTIDTQNGVQIPELDKSAVVSYELYEENLYTEDWRFHKNNKRKLTIITAN